MQKNFVSAAMLLVLGFVLGSFRGYLALWDADRPDPIQIFPCPVSALPEADQDALENGIPARSRMELDRLLEDYLS
jgi:hypothetical protein